MKEKLPLPDDCKGWLLYLDAHDVLIGEIRFGIHLPLGSTLDMRGWTDVAVVSKEYVREQVRDLERWAAETMLDGAS